MKKLTEIVKIGGLEIIEQKSIVERFGDYEAIAKEWEKKAKAIVVTERHQITEMAMAKTARKKFSRLRIDVEKARKAMKEQSLRKSQAIDAVARFLFSLISPIEEYLKEQENFIQIQEAQKAEEARIEAEKKIEAERIAKEKAEKKKQEQIRKENLKLKREAEEREAKIEKERKEREKAQAKIEKEREKRERIEAELQAKKDEEERRKREAEIAERERLAEIAEAKKEELKRPDREKYLRYIQLLLEVSSPQVQNKEFQTKISKIREFLKGEHEKNNAEI